MVEEARYSRKVQLFRWEYKDLNLNSWEVHSDCEHTENGRCNENRMKKCAIFINMLSLQGFPNSLSSPYHRIKQEQVLYVANVEVDYNWFLGLIIIYSQRTTKVWVRIRKNIIPLLLPKKPTWPQMFLHLTLNWWDWWKWSCFSQHALECWLD